MYHCRECTAIMAMPVVPEDTRERTFAETTDEMRQAACFIAGHMPHIPDRTPRPSGRVGNSLAQLFGNQAKPRASRNVGDRFGFLVIKKKKAHCGGWRYQAWCVKCGSTVQKTAEQLSMARHRNYGCGCRTRVGAAA